jgi:hypothetical protein
MEEKSSHHHHHLYQLMEAAAKLREYRVLGTSLRLCARQIVKTILSAARFAQCVWSRLVLVENLVLHHTSFFLRLAGPNDGGRWVVMGGCRLGGPWTVCQLYCLAA